MGIRRTTSGLTRRIAGFGLLVATAAAAETPAQDRKDWAYPSGVFVNVPALGGPAMALDGTDREVEAIAKEAADTLHACVARERLAMADLQNKGARYAFTLTFSINTDGRIHEGLVRMLTGSAELLPCMTALALHVETKRLSPLPPARRKKGESTGPVPKATWTQLSLAATILTDAEAQGRGYLFLKAERAWEQTLRENRHWFACGKKDDCVLVYEACEVAAVNGKFEADLNAAAKKRVKAACRPPDAPEVLTPACNAGRCTPQRL